MHPFLVAYVAVAAYVYTHRYIFDSEAEDSNPSSDTEEYEHPSTASPSSMTSSIDASSTAPGKVRTCDAKNSSVQNSSDISHGLSPQGASHRRRPKSVHWGPNSIKYIPSRYDVSKPTKPPMIVQTRPTLSNAKIDTKTNTKNNAPTTRRLQKKKRFPTSKATLKDVISRATTAPASSLTQTTPQVLLAQAYPILSVYAPDPMNELSYKRRRLCAPGDEFNFDSKGSHVLQVPTCPTAVTVLAVATGGDTTSTMCTVEVEIEDVFTGFLNHAGLDAEDEFFESGCDEPLSTSESAEGSNPSTPPCRPRRIRKSHRHCPELPTRRSPRIAAVDSSSLGSGYGLDGRRFSLRIRSRQATSLL